jgi:hypothetical protein
MMVPVEILQNIKVTDWKNQIHELVKFPCHPSMTQLGPVHIPKRCLMLFIEGQSQAEVKLTQNVMAASEKKLQLLVTFILTPEGIPMKAQLVDLIDYIPWAQREHMMQILQSMISIWGRDMNQMILVEIPTMVLLVDFSFHVKNGDQAQG